MKASLTVRGIRGATMIDSYDNDQIYNATKVKYSLNR